MSATDEQRCPICGRTFRVPKGERWKGCYNCAPPAVKTGLRMSGRVPEHGRAEYRSLPSSS